MASVWVENGVLYEMGGSGLFYTHMQVRNGSDTTVGIDAGGEGLRIGPIQYAALDSPVMQVIDILSTVPPVMTDSLAEEASALFERGELTEIPPGGAFDYYAPFNAAGRAEVDALDARWLMMAYGGWLTVTDGITAEILSPEGGFIYIPARFPVTWAGVPSE
jgi:hypothetical protein